MLTSTHSFAFPINLSFSQKALEQETNTNKTALASCRAIPLAEKDTLFRTNKVFNTENDQNKRKKKRLHDNLI